MYRCKLCDAISRPRQKLKRVVVMRPRAGGGLTTAREVAVCSKCEAEVAGMFYNGVPMGDALQVVRNRHHNNLISGRVIEPLTA